MPWQGSRGPYPAMPLRPLLDGRAQDLGSAPNFGDETWVGEQVLVGGGSVIGDKTILDHYVIVESDVVIGRESLACYRAQICAGAQIGDRCVLGGFIGERSTIGSNCRVFGSLVHRHPRNWGGWDDDSSMVDGPRLDDGVFIAFGAVVVGNVHLGEGVYIGANAVVCCDLPPGFVVGPGEVRSSK